MASQEEKDLLISQFQGITGQDVDQSRFYLESADWKLDMAMSSFYENDDQGAGGALPEAMDAAPAAAAPPPVAAAPPTSRRPARDTGGSSRIATFGSLRGANRDSDDSEEEGQAFFAGGSDTSGQQILGPPRKKGEALVKELFKKAREAGAEEVDPNAPGGSRGGAGGSSFSGTAFKLGSETMESEEIPPPGGARRTTEPPREFTLKMWQNGFSIDDGELRAYNDHQNRAFLAAVMTGQIPEELIREAKGGEVHVNMEDHKHEEFVKPKVKAKAFSGAGHMLGSVAPDVAVASVSVPVVAAADPADKTKNEAAAKEQVKVDASQPTTFIQVRMHDGSRLKIQLNQSQTVGDIRRYVTISRPEIAAQTFILMTSFPNKELTDDQATLKDAGLLNAAILLKLK
ncbi:NSFL1 cofactor p47-like [Tigriopus californicus]|nr:NSFL1 cofactor p47-like [Tigriopus californicus]|eukprot:TCALIF_10231-PA protein Name:"Similar to NSFL1C NSFL1 cofactor p47 (Gallus gallus)" AED:0.02 eAED:0.02 QI:173/1/1/1/0.66/0.5/4/139/400